MFVDLVYGIWMFAQSPSRRDDRGEGVISTAIAVLIVAFLGAAAYLVFNNIIEGSGKKACDQVNDIGGGGNVDC